MAGFWGMRWKKKEKVKVDLCEWHPWFAWYPVQLTHNGKDVVWLETIRRQWFGWGEGWWEYQDAPKKLEK